MNPQEFRLALRSRLSDLETALKTYKEDAEGLRAALREGRQEIANCEQTIACLTTILRNLDGEVVGYVDEVDLMF